MWILALVFAGVGLPMVLIAQRSFAGDRVAAGWPLTDAVVKSSRLSTSNQRYTEKTGLSFTRTMYTPHVSYTYQVNGQEFEGTGIGRGVMTSQDSAQEYMHRYPPQKKVRVRYNPEDPKTAYLELGRNVGAIILLCFGIFWMALGTLMAGLWLRTL